MLEFVNTKMGLQSFNHCVEYGAIAGQNFTNDRLTRIKLLVDRTSQINRQFCSNCQKPGHFVCNCFALRKCFNCNEKGQIAKNCNKTRSAPATIDSLEGLTKEHLVPEHRTLISFALVMNLFRFYMTPDLNTQTLLEKQTKTIYLLINPHFPV